VFFFIDPDFEKDPRMHGVDEIILSYTFFEAEIVSEEASRAAAVFERWGDQPAAPASK
jgi:cytochrome c oxidase assembly protein Cox11